jgi:hypothetical protein
MVSTETPKANLFDNLLCLQLFSNGTSEQDVAATPGRRSPTDDLQIQTVIDDEVPTKHETMT